MTCRDEVLAAFDRLEGRQGQGVFDLAVVVQEVLGATRAYKESTVRTHVVFRMCGDAEANHGTVCADVDRVERGRYRRRHR